MARNRNGDGSVFQVSENKWVAKISLGTKPDGSPKVKQFSGKTESIVRKKLKEYKKSVEFAEKRLPTAETARSYFEKWLKEIQYFKLKPSSYDRLERTLHNNIYPYLGGLKMDKITRNQVQTLVNQLYNKQGLSYSTVKKAYVALNSGFQYALLDDVVSKNPCLGVELPAEGERKTEAASMSPVDVTRLVEEIAKTDKNGNPLYHYGYAFVLILNTGLRMGEALALTWEDVDWERRLITVNKNMVMTKKRDNEGETRRGYEMTIQNSAKTVSGNRSIPINKTAEDALRKLQNNNDTPYVVVNNRQHRVLPSNFERSFHAVLKNAGLERYGVHALRHTFASNLFRKGVDVKIISRLLGHSTVKITYDIYVHLLDEDIGSVTSVLDCAV